MSHNDSEVTDREEIEEALADVESAEHLADRDTTVHASPRPGVIQQEMDWFDAGRQILLGKKITRRSWPDAGCFVWLLDDRLKYRNERGVIHDLITSGGDMSATDWVVVREN